MSDDTDKLHDLTKFLLARMKSYPEEFKIERSGHTRAGVGAHTINTRWAPDIDFILYQHGSEADKAALNRGLMDFQFRDALERLLTSGDGGGGGDGVALNSMAHPAAGTPGVSGGNGGPGGMNVNIGPMSPGTLTHIYDQATQRHMLDVRSVGRVTMTREEAEDLGLKSKETIIEALKRKLGL